MTQALIHTTKTNGQINRWERRDHPYMGGLLYVEFDSQDLTLGQRFTQYGEVQTWECQLQEFLDGCFHQSITDDFGAETLQQIKQNVYAHLNPASASPQAPTSPTTASSASQAPQTPATSPQRHSLTLQSFGPKKIAVIKITRELLNLGLKDAKQLVERAPTLFAEDLTLDEANAFQEALKAAGATSTIQGPPSTTDEQSASTQTFTFYSITLESFGRKKIAVIKAVRTITGLGLKDTKALVESAPCLIKENLFYDEAQAVQESLKAIGATTSINVIVPPTDDTGSEPPTTSTHFDVYLNNHGPKKIAVIKAIRELLGLGLKEAKHTSERTPIKIATNLTAAEAQRYKDRLEEVGANVRLQGT